MSETLYNTVYYPSLLAFIDTWSTPESLCIIGTKTFYFGLGGGTFEFTTFLERTAFSVEIREKINDLKSIER